MSTLVQERQATDTIAGYLERDHDALDAILEDAATMVDDGEMERAEHTFGEFDRGLARHIRIEEELLFPLFEARMSSGWGTRPVATMSIEHRHIERSVATMRDALARGDAAGFRAAHSKLLAQLPPHNMKEERFLYPAIDGVLTSSEREAMLHRLRSA